MTGSTTLSLFSPNMKLARRARLVLGRVLMSGALLWCSVAQASPGNDAAREAMESAAETELVTLEKRPFAKAGRGELSLGISTIASDIFLVYMPVTLRGAYHFKEWVSLELSASYMGCFTNDVGDNQTRAAGQGCMRFLTPTYDNLIKRQNETELRGVTIKEYQVARFALNPVFSVFMGKFALAGEGIAHFELNVTAGLGVQIVEMPGKTRSHIEYGASFEGNLGAGVRFVFMNFVGLRMDFREYLFGKQRDKGLGTASEFSLSVSFLL